MSVSPPMRFKAFISYAHADEAFATWLHRALERYRTPKRLLAAHPKLPRRLAPVFRDREELASAADLSGELETALKQAEWLIVICSQAAARSRWVNREIEYYIQHHGDAQVLCCIADGIPPDNFPPALGVRERLAADFRAEGDGRRNAFLKLASGLLRVRYDELRQRDAQARQRRLAIVAASAGVGMVVMSYLALTAYLGQQEARRQAEVASRVTDFMVGVFEVSDPGSARGKTVTARELLARSAERIDHELEDQPAVRRRLLETLSSVHANLGLYREALTLRSKAIDAMAGTAGNQEAARAQIALGELHSLVAEHQEARTVLERALAAVERSAGSDHPDVARAATALAAAQAMLGDAEAAEANYRRALALREARLGADDPAVAQSLVHLAWLYLEQDRVAEALELAQRSARIRRERLGPDHFLLSESLDLVAAAELRAGDPEAALAVAEESLALRTRVLDETHPMRARSFKRLADVHFFAGRPERAEALIGEGIALAEQSLGPDNAELAEFRERLAFILEATGRFESAAAERRRILDHYRRAYGDEHLQVGRALNNLGALLTEQLGRHDEAAPLLEAALATLDTVEDTPTWRGLVRWTLANCYREQQATDQAAPLYEAALDLLSGDAQLGTADYPGLDALRADYAKLMDLGGAR